MGEVEKSHSERHEAARQHLIELYGKVQELLCRLPLPVRVPALRGEVYRAEVAAGLVQAFTAVSDLPMDDAARRVLREVIGDWLIAVEWLFGDEEDQAAWHLDIVQTQLRRIDAAAEEGAMLLAGSAGRP
jgi:hypothetical protein